VNEAATNLKQHLISIVLELSRITEVELLEKRYKKYRKIGFFEKKVLADLEKKKDEAEGEKK
jgi:acetyl-CoA carboxylase alpha subunit